MENEEYEIQWDDEPLKDYLASKERKILMEAASGICSANWRGYVGKWALVEETLYLNQLKIDACINPKLMDPFKLFGKNEYPIKATWFSGTITIWVEDSEVEEIKAKHYHFCNGTLFSTQIDEKDFDHKKHCP